MAACKPSQVSNSASVTYEEDISFYWKADVNNTDIEVEEVDDSLILPASPEPFGHIKAELDSVISMIAYRNEQKRTWDGFIIQVYSGLSRDRAYEAKRLVQSVKPNLATRIEYYQPSYRVKCGAYFDQLEAHSVHEELLEYFPQALLLPEKVSLNAVQSD